MTAGLFLGHLGLGDQILLTPAIYHFATTCGYNKLYVVVKAPYRATLQALLSEMPATAAEICYLSIRATASITEELAEILAAMKTIDGSCQPVNMHLSGQFNFHVNAPGDFPICFYNQLGVAWPAAVLRYIVPCTSKSSWLAGLLTYIPYIFIHDISSTCRIDSAGSAGTALMSAVERCRDKYLLVNPEKNMYPVGHVLHRLAEQFIRESNGLTLIDYKDVIENAAELHMITSSYFCFAAGLLEVRTATKVAYSRNGDRFPTIAGDWTYVDI
jgi:hypothetical protein